MSRERLPKDPDTSFGSDALTVEGYYWTRYARSTNRQHWTVRYVKRTETGAWAVLVFGGIDYTTNRHKGMVPEKASEFRFVGPLTEQRPNF